MKSLKVRLLRVVWLCSVSWAALLFGAAIAGEERDMKWLTLAMLALPSAFGLIVTYVVSASIGWPKYPSAILDAGPPPDHVAVKRRRYGYLLSVLAMLAPIVFALTGSYSSFDAGRTIGQVLAIFALVYLIGSALLVSSDARTKSNFLIALGLVCCGLVAADVWPNIRDRAGLRRAADDVARAALGDPSTAAVVPRSTMNDANASVTQQATDAAETAKILSSITPIVARAKAETGEYEKKTLALEMDKVLTPSSLATPMGREIAMLRVDIAERLVERAYDATAQFRNEMREAIKASPVSERSRQAAIQSFERGALEQVQIADELRAVQKKVIAEIRLALQFVNSVDGQYSIRDGKIMFAKPEHLARWNELLNKLIEVSDEETRVREMALRSQQQSLRQMVEDSRK